ncbi:MAG: dicarboxylate/amino acid:cation symporter [Bacilli bacterium]|nr:dicarboxylate/amino acid:cation symporter [Bacilli bacterium]
MMKKLNKISTVATIFALVIAIIIGFCAPSFAKDIEYIGTRYLKVLKFLIGPVIICSIACAMLKKNKDSKFLVGKTVAIFIIMFVTTFLLCSGIVALAKPGSSFSSSIDSSSSKLADFSIKSILLNLIPNDLEKFFFAGNIFFIIVVTLIIFFIISKTKIREKTYEVMKDFKKGVDFALNVVVLLTPFAVVSLLSNMIVNYDTSMFNMGLRYILYAYGLSILTIILVMILPVWFIAKINPLTYIRKVAKVWLFTISSCSSAATLPYTIKTCNEEFGIDEKITDVVVPLGCTIHMCGGAVSFALLGFFVAQLTGNYITFPLFMLMLVSATLINMAAPGIPGGGVVIGMTYLSILNLPFEGFYGLYAGMYKLLDMSYTTLNVTGDICANILLNHFENNKKKEK